ncbi:MAG: ATP-binding protein [Terrisporobacter sp.]
MCGKFYPEVKNCSVFKETALNTVKPLEILREAISNSDDANAHQIYISTDRDPQGQLIITIEDNGDGMCIDEIHKFFNLGFSYKTLNKIGEKGLGTKIFYRSNSIYIETCTRDGSAYSAYMDSPWDKLENNEIPEYEIKKCDELIKRGTKIIVSGYKVDNPENFFNVHTIKDYIQWFTIGGSFRNIFANNIKVRQLVNNIDAVPQIIINDKINNKSEIIVGMHQFEEPNENPIIDLEEIYYKKSSDYARTFGPFNRETNINGEYVSVQVYGTISGINAKEKIYKLNEGESYKSRFGLYLCKDFIPCVKSNNLIDEDEYYHYHIMANSQNFKLTSDRNNISNINDIKIKWVLEQIQDILNSQIKPIAEREYFSMIRKEEEEYKVRKKCEKTKENIKKLARVENLGVEVLPIAKQPRNEIETALLFVAILSNPRTKKWIEEIEEILSYSPKLPTDMVCLSKNDTNILVEIELKLSNFFKHKHPVETVDYIICWKIDIDENRLYEINNKNCVFISENDHEYLAFNEKTIKIIELKKIVEKVSLLVELA